jgi:hypothetical protein
MGQPSAWWRHGSDLANGKADNLDQWDQEVCGLLAARLNAKQRATARRRVGASWLEARIVGSDTLSVVYLVRGIIAGDFSAWIEF